VALKISRNARLALETGIQVKARDASFAVIVLFFLLDAESVRIKIFGFVGCCIIGHQKTQI